jgi:hypothetical protein
MNAASSEKLPTKGLHLPGLFYCANKPIYSTFIAVAAKENAK